MTREYSSEEQSIKPDKIEDLADEQVTSADAEQVKGGFNPQPDPPKVAVDPVSINAKYVKW
jgi:hypothetical protein